MSLLNGWAWYAGHILGPAAFFVATLVAYAAFTSAHEAAHGNVSGGAHPWLDHTAGWIGSIFLAAPYSAFRVLHLQHHSHTNDPEKDPDFYVAGGSALSVVARCFTIVPHYYGTFLFGASSRTKAARDARTGVVAWLTGFALSLAALFAFGLGHAILLLWIGPAVIATGFLAFGFDWLPHAPHTTIGRYRDTRVVLFPGLSLLLLWQNYHLIHHLWPRVPFYRYGVCFDRVRAHLEEEGAEIVDLQRPRPPVVSGA